MILEKFQTYKPFYKSTLLLAGPVMVSQLGHTLVQMADSVIVGHFLGTIPLAAVSLVHAVFMVVLVIGLGIAYGITPLIAQASGRDDKEECAKLLSNSIWVNTVTGIVIFFMVYYGSMFAIGHLDQDPNVVKEAIPYLFIMSLSIIPLMIFNSFKQFAEGLGFTKQAMNISIWGNVVNVIVAIVFVKGMFGIEPMGISGVGYATLIDRILMMLVMGIYVFKAQVFKDYMKFFDILNLQWLRCKNILRIGAPAGLQNVFEVGAFAAAGIIAGTIGANEQAAHQVAIQISVFSYMIASGFATAATIKVGNNYGNKNVDRLKKYTFSSYHLVIIFMSIMAIMFIAFNKLLPNLITTDTVVVLIAAQLLIISGGFQILDGVQVVALGILRGIGDVNIPTVLTFISYWVIGIPSSYILGIVFDFGVKGIWMGLALALLSSSVLLYLRSKIMMKKIIPS